jgi:hypothetical protein
MLLIGCESNGRAARNAEELRFPVLLLAFVAVVTVDAIPTTGSRIVTDLRCYNDKRDRLAARRDRRERRPELREASGWSCCVVRVSTPSAAPPEGSGGTESPLACEIRQEKPLKLLGRRGDHNVIVAPFVPKDFRVNCEPLLEPVVVEDCEAEFRLDPEDVRGGVHGNEVVEKKGVHPEVRGDL